MKPTHPDLIVITAPIEQRIVDQLFIPRRMPSIGGAGAEYADSCFDWFCYLRIMSNEALRQIPKYPSTSFIAHIFGIQPIPEIENNKSRVPNIPDVKWFATQARQQTNVIGRIASHYERSHRNRIYELMETRYSQIAELSRYFQARARAYEKAPDGSMEKLDLLDGWCGKEIV